MKASKYNENKEFIENLYNQYRDIIYLKIKSRCFSKSEQDIEDCISQTFLIALQNCNTLKNHPNPQAYLLKTATNVIRNFNNKYNKDILKTEPINDNIPHTISIEDQFEDKLTEQEIQNRNIYQNIMNGLTPAQQQLYFLYFVENKNSTEISKLLGEKNSTIRMRISRLRLCIINKIKFFLK